MSTIQKYAKETTALTGRSLRHITRSPDTILTTALMPLAVLALFVYVLGGAVSAGTTTGTTYIDYVLPGILLMTIAVGCSYTAYRLFMDMQNGMLDRLNSLPIHRSAILWAHVSTSVAANLTSVAVVIAGALVMGFRTNAGVLRWLAVCGILLLFTLALTWVAVLAALSAKSVDGAAGVLQPLIFLPFVSSAFVPTDTMPGPIRWFAEHQPVTSIVNTIRDLLGGEPVGHDIWVALAWCAGIFVAACLTSVAVYRKKIT